MLKFDGINAEVALCITHSRECVLLNVVHGQLTSWSLVNRAVMLVSLFCNTFVFEKKWIKCSQLMRIQLHSENVSHRDVCHPFSTLSSASLNLRPSGIFHDTPYPIAKPLSISITRGRVKRHRCQSDCLAMIDCYRPRAKTTIASDVAVARWQMCHAMTTAARLGWCRHCSEKNWVWRNKACQLKEAPSNVFVLTNCLASAGIYVFMAQ